MEEGIELFGGEIAEGGTGFAEGDILLVKASRAVGAERVVEYIKAKLEK